MSRCDEPTCFVHDGEGCPLGHPTPADCPRWAKAEPAAGDDPSSDARSVEQGARVPWSGAALGLADLPLLTPRGQTVLIGVLGAHDAGKTTLLTGAYLWLLRGHHLADSAFAGSRTLSAWESLAAWTRLDGSDRQPTFPPHTSRDTARGRGLLHIALRGGNERLYDVLLTDASGEWFTEWARRADGDEAAGARWIVERADGFLLVADCARLSGDEKGPALRQLFEIIDRLAPAVNGRPTTLVWAKSGHPISPGYRQRILRRLKARIAHADNRESRVADPETLAQVVGHAITESRRPAPAQRLTTPVVDPSPFGAFRGYP